MAKRVVIIHGYQGEPMRGFRPWLKVELEARGFSVSVPAMPSPDEPRVEDWVAAIAKEVGDAGKDCVLVGHSLGCAAILRYLESAERRVTNLGLKAEASGTEGGATRLGAPPLPEGKWLPHRGSSVAGAVLVAGFAERLGDEFRAIEGFVQPPLDFGRVKKNCERMVAIFSDNDPYIPLSQAEVFEKKLGAKVVVLHARGHFSSSEGTTELPEARDAILGISR